MPQNPRRQPPHQVAWCSRGIPCTGLLYHPHLAPIVPPTNGALSTTITTTEDSGVNLTSWPKWCALIILVPRQCCCEMKKVENHGPRAISSKVVSLNPSYHHSANDGCHCIHVDQRVRSTGLNGAYFQVDLHGLALKIEDSGATTKLYSQTMSDRSYVRWEDVMLMHSILDYPLEHLPWLLQWTLGAILYCLQTSLKRSPPSPSPHLWQHPRTPVHSLRQRQQLFLGPLPNDSARLKHTCIYLCQQEGGRAVPLTWCLNFLPPKPSWIARVITENSSTISWEFCSCLQQAACSCLSIGGLPVHQFINK